MKMIADFTDGERVDGQFLVSSCARCLSNAGKPYLNLTLQDSSGTISAKKWDVEEGDEEILLPGQVVSVSGDVLDYKGSLQFKIHYVRDLDQSKIDVARFALPCPVDPEILTAKLDKYLDSLKEGELKTLMKGIFKDNREAYISYPAAVKNHHNCLGGLMYHSVRMADLAEEICKLYPGLNRDLLISGCLIHDIGKTVELSGPVATRYTLEGKLIGHIAIGEALIEKKAEELGLFNEEILLLRHMILSHHGVPEHGSAIRPMTREAFALAAIDDFDAKMDIIDKALDGVQEGEWSQRVYPMDDSYFYKPF